MAGTHPQTVALRWDSICIREVESTPISLPLRLKHLFQELYNFFQSVSETSSSRISCNR
jgi:hypothetical protein